MQVQYQCQLFYQTQFNLRTQIIAKQRASCTEFGQISLGKISQRTLVMEYSKQISYCQEIKKQYLPRKINKLYDVKIWLEKQVCHFCSFYTIFNAILNSSQEICISFTQVLHNTIQLNSIQEIGISFTWLLHNIQR